MLSSFCSPLNSIPDIPGIISVVTAGIISVVGIIWVVIGGHFGGRDHFDGGDHFGGGTGSHWISKEYDLHVVSLGFLWQIFLRNDFDLFYCLFYFLRGTFAAVVTSSSFVGKECQSKFKEITMRVPSVKCFQSLFLFDIYSFFFIYFWSVYWLLHPSKHQKIMEEEKSFRLM